jgi:hypothetical protein
VSARERDGADADDIAIRRAADTTPVLHLPDSPGARGRSEVPH